MKKEILIFSIIFFLGCLAGFEPTKEPQENYLGRTLALGFERIKIPSWSFDNNGEFFLEFRNYRGREVRISAVKIIMDNVTATVFPDVQLFESSGFEYTFRGLPIKEKGSNYWAYVDITYQELIERKTEHETGNLCGVIK